MQYLLTQEEMDKIKDADSNIDATVRVKQLEEAIEKFVMEAEVTSFRSAQDFGGINIAFSISGNKIPEEFAEVMRAKGVRTH